MKLSRCKALQLLSPWFGPDETPIRAGVYQTQDCVTLQQYWSRWDGEEWGLFCTRFRAAAVKQQPAGVQDKIWRGIVK